MSDKPPSPWLTAQEAADHVRSPNVKAFYMWRKRHGVVAGLYGHQLRFTRADLDKAMGAGRTKQAS
jgi:hypothetical protein